MCVFVKTAGRPERRGFNKSRSSWPRALSSLVLISVSGFQPAANCSLISQSQEALATPAAGRQTCPLLPQRQRRSRLLPPQRNPVHLTWTLRTPWMQAGPGSQGDGHALGGGVRGSGLLPHPHLPQELRFSEGGRYDTNDRKFKHILWQGEIFPFLDHNEICVYSSPP